MDPVRQLALTRELVDIDSTTGREDEAGRWIVRLLTELGYHVHEQEVAPGRRNIVATTERGQVLISDPLAQGSSQRITNQDLTPFGHPDVVLSTHFDCVPPFFPSRVDGDRLYGRGSCDAKGALVAMIAASERLRAEGETRVGLLFVIGEERGSEGAKLANTIAPGSRYLIDGEPTGNKLGRASRGVYRARVRAEGRAAHTSQPNLGVSAIERLIDALVRMRDVEWPDDPVLGRTFYVVGLISGGIAPNVIPPEAEAEMMFRTVGDHNIVRELAQTHAGEGVFVEDTLVVPPVHLKTLPGFESDVFNFTTDIPFLDNWGEPLLLGPGSVAVAHTAEEHVEIAELHRAAELYADVARGLLSSAG